MRTLVFMKLIALLTLLTASPEAPSNSWILSALGAAEDQTTLGIGVAYANGTPSVDLRLLHGLTPRIGLDVEVATLGYAQLARAGARLRILDRDNLAVALRASLFEGHDTHDVWVSAGPGAIASFGTAEVQVSASVDLAVMLHETNAVAVRPAIGLEIPLDLGLALVVESGAIVTTLASPFFSAGVSW